MHNSNSFRPRINKRSQDMNRTRDNLFSWKEEKENNFKKKIENIERIQKEKSIPRANKTSEEILENKNNYLNVSVSERLYNNAKMYYFVKN